MLTKLFLIQMKREQFVEDGNLVRIAQQVSYSVVCHNGSRNRTRMTCSNRTRTLLYRRIRIDLLHGKVDYPATADERNLFFSNARLV